MALSARKQVIMILGKAPGPWQVDKGRVKIRLDIFEEKAKNQFPVDRIVDLCYHVTFFTMPMPRKITRLMKNPFFRLGIPTTAAVVLGTLFMSELVRINNLMPNRPSGIREEDIVDTFDLKKELEVHIVGQSDTINFHHIFLISLFFALDTDDPHALLLDYRSKSRFRFMGLQKS